MHRLVAFGSLIFAAACTTSTTPTGTATNADTSGAGCDVGPCTERPIIFIHGHGGSSSDGNAIFGALTAPGERFDQVTLAGISDHAAWAADSIPRRSWLFSLDYYNSVGNDARGAFTAGAGRIGSDNQLCADHDSYNEGFGHEFTNDLATFVDDVLRATGASQVDIVTHSMGGLITRSYLTFVAGARARVANVLFIDTPQLGVPAASDQKWVANEPAWMPDHESTELDRLKLTSHSDFSRCGTAGTDTWPNQLLKAELALPADSGPVEHCLKGSKDLYIWDDSANYARCVDYEVVPGFDHSGMLSAPDAIAKARALGGTYKP